MTIYVLAMTALVIGLLIIGAFITVPWLVVPLAAVFGVSFWSDYGRRHRR